ncbi:MAG: right-handed parallel beta-helix repeat-containing protein [Candidatus Zixiibacteriota bacterium]|nr:MAG: right-handed parallel beta-helix repeat-containing protein [candidate division Zixibacteria bacterium]
MSIVLSLVPVFLFLSEVRAPIIHVPGESSTIQLGLNSAQQGDTVLVAPGVYPEVIFWPATNAVKLLSEAGADSTTIDGSDLSSVIYFPGLGEIDTTTVLRGFRITNGGAVEYGGGIYLTQSSPMVEHCTVESNNAGGGIFCNYGSTPTIRFCVVTRNSGGGIGFSKSGGTLDSCSILDNVGPGIFATQSCLNVLNSRVGSNSDIGIEFDACVLSSITNCTIDSNQILGVHCINSSGVLISNTVVSGNVGDGVLSNDLSNPTLISSTIRDNASDGIVVRGHKARATLESCQVIFNGENGIYIRGRETAITTVHGSLVLGNSGAGIFCYYSCSPTISNTVVAGNHSGGIVCDAYTGNPSPTITGCAIIRNSAPQGGGIYCYSYSPFIKHCTISENRASDKGDGIYTVTGSWPTLDSNNICYNGYGVHNADNSQLLSAQDQWWGHASGPYHPNYNPGGLGDSVNYFVYPLPHLAEADTNAPPIPPVGLDTVEVGDDFVSVIWLAAPMGDLAGYRLYFDSDSSGFPYSDTTDAGSDTCHTLVGLTSRKTHYIAITSYDNSGNESWYSSEIRVTPGGTLVHGDANGDGTLNVGDVIYLLVYLYRNGSAPNPIEAGDVNCDGTVNVGDVVYLVNYLYKGGPPPSC